MKFEEKLELYQKEFNSSTRDDKIQETVVKVQRAFLKSEEERILSYSEFLRIQFQLIRKRWWLLQVLLLVFLWYSITLEPENIIICRSMGVVSNLFVILIIPELWKNKTYQSIEIEGTSYYSLRQIYAARMLIMGMTDFFFVTTFCVFAYVENGIYISDMVVQFLLPMVITSCICFRTLCGKYQVNEVMAVTLCMIFGAVWTLLVINEKVYAKIAEPLWIICFGISLMYLIITIYRILNKCNHYLEGDFNGTTI